MRGRWVGLITAGLALTAFVLMAWVAVSKGLNLGIVIGADYYIAFTAIAGAATLAFSVAAFWPRRTITWAGIGAMAMAVVFVFDAFMGAFGNLSALAYASLAALLSSAIGLVNVIRPAVRRSTT